MKRQLLVLSSVLNESAKWLQIDPARDWMTIQSRIKHEGDSFLEITLPAMHDALMLSVSSGHWVPNRLWKQSRQGSPVFMQEFLGRVFDFGSSAFPIKETPDVPLALRVIRQILLLNGKVKALPSLPRQRKAIEGFFETEMELRDKRQLIIEASNSSDFQKICTILYAELFSRVEQRLDELPVKNGPGQTAESAFGLRKYSLLTQTWTSRLEKSFPLSQHGVFNYADYSDQTGGEYDFSALPPKNETPMRITLVPKTAKTPRLIAMEPIVNQFVQQGILSLIDEFIGKDPILAGSVSWRDQTRNRRLAQRGSEDGSLATLDLSEASDRLHVVTVHRMLRHHPSLRRAVFSCRSRQADFDGNRIFLHKFAPMGSALCFAFESLAFMAMSVLGVSRALGLQISRSSVRSMAKRISVYGDDIIVRTETASQVADTLESFGLKVNRRKSFWTGMFRESCGAEFFRGVDVSVVRLREKFDSSLGVPRNTISWVATQNLFFLKGWFNTSEMMASAIRSVPRCTPSDGAGLRFFDHSISGKTRWNRDLQRLEIFVPVPVFKDRTADSLGREILFHWFVSRRDAVDPSERDITPVVGRPELARLRVRFMAVS